MGGLGGREKRVIEKAICFSIEFLPCHARDKNAQFVVKKGCDYLLRLIPGRTSAMRWYCWPKKRTRSSICCCMVRPAPVKPFLPAAWRGT